jgi:hypothetical protein
MSQADQIRQFVVIKWIEPARKAGESMVRIRSGEVHHAMGLKNRMPSICDALDAQVFLDVARVTLVNRTGPHQGSTAEWVFALE